MTTIYPTDLFTKLSDVIGQKEAKKAISVAFARYLNSLENNLDLPAPRVLLKGETGSGKTFLLTNLEKHTDIKFFWVNSTELTGSGWAGKGLKDVKESLVKFKEAHSLRKVGIVFDEFDKLSNVRNGGGTSEGGHKTSLQDDLLKFLEDERDVPMFFLGTFNELVDIENHKPIIDKHVGFFSGNVKDDEPKLSFKDKLSKSGFTKELVGRINTVAVLNKLEITDLIQILEEQVLINLVKEFKGFNVAVMFSDEFKEGIADLALQNHTGARGLRDVVEAQTCDLFFDIGVYKYHRIVFDKVGKNGAEFHSIERTKRCGGVKCI